MSARQKREQGSETWVTLAKVHGKAGIRTQAF